MMEWHHGIDQSKIVFKVVQWGAKRTQMWLHPVDCHHHRVRKQRGYGKELDPFHLHNFYNQSFWVS